MAITCKSSGIFEENIHESFKSIMLELIETCDTNKPLISVECQSINGCVQQSGCIESLHNRIYVQLGRINGQSDQWAIGSVLMPMYPIGSVSNQICVRSGPCPVESVFNRVYVCSINNVRNRASLLSKAV